MALTAAMAATVPKAPKAPAVFRCRTHLAADKLPLLFSSSGITVADVRALVSGTGPSTTFSLRYGADYSGACTKIKTEDITSTSTITGDSFSSFENAAIPAGSWLWLVVESISGTVLNLHISVRFSS